MSTDKDTPLYEDRTIRITRSQGEDCRRGYDLRIGPNSHCLPESVLQNITTRSTRNDLYDLIKGGVPAITTTELEPLGLTPESIGFAVCRAHTEEQKRFETQRRIEEYRISCPD